MTKRLTARHIALLKNAPGKNASTERALTKSIDALSTSLEAIGGQLRSESALALQKILKTALNLSRMKGIYEGLGEGFWLHEFSLEIANDPAERSLLRRIYRYPPQSKDREVTNEGLCKYLDGEIERLSGTDGQPLPPHKWGIDARQINPWQFALRDNKLRPRVLTHLNRMRQEAWGQTYSFLRAWEELSPKTEGNGFLRKWDVGIKTAEKPVRGTAEKSL
jgi:hypothetical protein